MNEDDKTLMAKYEITSAPRQLFFYRDFKYDNLSDAVQYARNDEERMTIFRAKERKNLPILNW